MLASALLFAVTALPQPAELGLVSWNRDYPEAVREAERTGKPLLVLFDEVPGCSTVLNFGHTVLSNADIVSFVEQHFVAVAVYNNIGGVDAEVLKSFQEPRWNNPVVRIIDTKRRPLAPRFDGPYTVEAFWPVLKSALAKTDPPKPKL